MIELINNHVLFPHAANWSDRPKRRREWETGIAEAVTGSQSRYAMRTQPRLSLSYLVTPRSLQEQAQLEDRIMAAKKSGLACAPFWGRASVLNADCNSTDIELQSAFWPWKIGDVVFFLDPDNFDYRSLVDVDGVNLTLDDAPAQFQPSGTRVWPLIFGRFSCQSMEAVTNHRGAVQITIAEEKSPASATIGVANPPVGTGIGFMKIGSTFTIA